MPEPNAWKVLSESEAPLDSFHDCRVRGMRWVPVGALELHCIVEWLEPADGKGSYRFLVSEARLTAWRPPSQSQPSERNQSKMKEEAWYAVKLLFESQIDGLSGVGEQLWEESIRLVRATSYDDASARAEQLARSEDRTYFNDEGGRVDWVLREVLEAQSLGELEFESGVEVFSHMFWKSVAEDE